MRRKGTPTDLGAALTKIVGRLDRSSGGGWSSLRAAEAWSSVAGPQIAAHTGRVLLKGSELIVSVDSPIWATELGAMSEMLRQRINEVLGKPEVRSVRFSVSRDVSADRQRTQRDRQEAERAGQRVVPVPLGEEELARVRESVSAIENADLREAAFRATVKHLEWSRGIGGAKEP